MLTAWQSPNFALRTDEVLPIPPNELLSTPRFTSNVFSAVIIPSYEQGDLRTPAGMVDWPPKWLWEFVYGVVCTKHYGTEALYDYLDLNNMEYYPDNVRTAQDRIRRDILRQRQDAALRTSRDNDARNARASRRRGGERDQVDAVDWYDFVARVWDATRSTEWARAQVAQHEKEQAMLVEAASAKKVQDSINVVAEWKKGLQV